MESEASEKHGIEEEAEHALLSMESRSEGQGGGAWDRGGGGHGAARGKVKEHCCSLLLSMEQ
jgi:hypothetical protein